MTRKLLGLKAKEAQWKKEDQKAKKEALAALEAASGWLEGLADASVCKSGVATEIRQIQKIIGEAESLLKKYKV